MALESDVLTSEFARLGGRTVLERERAVTRLQNHLKGMLSPMHDSRCLSVLRQQTHESH